MIDFNKKTTTKEQIQFLKNYKTQNTAGGWCWTWKTRRTFLATPMTILAVHKT